MLNVPCTAAACPLHVCQSAEAAGPVGSHSEPCRPQAQPASRDLGYLHVACMAGSGPGSREAAFTTRMSAPPRTSVCLQDMVQQTGDKPH